MSAVPAADPVTAIRDFFSSRNRLTGQTVEPARIECILKELRQTGKWRAKLDELEWLGKSAWRNSERCLARAQWNSLEVIDAQECQRPDEVFDACVAHLRHSTQHGRIRSLLTVFPAAAPGERGIRIINSQLIRYAGYRHQGHILGDPDQVATTELALSLGWQAPATRSAFDVLPLIIDCPGHPLTLFSLPTDAVLEVPLQHPQLPWFEQMGWKWHALPVLANMALIGAGLRFTAAPFSGYYMNTEIACRNLADEQRYNLLPIIAQKMRLDTSQRALLWRERALIELNTAVLHSFRQHGVAMIDHHSASTQFIQYVKEEELNNRSVPGDWSWLVPPLAGSLCPVFHRYYSAERPEPSFVNQDDQAPTCPHAFKALE